MALDLIGKGREAVIVQFATGDVNNTRWYFARQSVKSVVVADPIIETGQGQQRAFLISVHQHDGGEMSAMYFVEATRDQQLVKLFLQLGIDNKLPLGSQVEV